MFIAKSATKCDHTGKSADNILKYFFIFFTENRFGISCKLFPKETILHEMTNLFSGKNIKKI